MHVEISAMSGESLSSLSRKALSTAICTDSARMMVAVHIRSCNTTDKNLPLAYMQMGMLPTLVAWIELSSKRVMSVGKRGISQGMHMFQGALESII